MKKLPYSTNFSDFLEIIKNSKNRHDALIKLNWDTNTYGYRILNKILKEQNVSIEHFETLQEKFKRINPLLNIKTFTTDQILVTGSTYNRTLLKKRLYKEGLKKRECELCGQGETWQGKKMSLILDHKNGVHDDNRIENLRILCPNCNATLPTHAGKNKKNKKPKLGYTIDTYNQSHLPMRIVQRPSIDQLKTEIETLGYRGTGKKYNVSDNTIRKWEKFYLKYS